MTDGAALVLRLDFGLLSTRLASEQFWARAGESPLSLFGSAKPVAIRPDLLPVRPEIVERARAAAATDGLVLISEADPDFVRQIAAANGISGKVEVAKEVPEGLTLTEVPRKTPQFRRILKAARPHQWVKNVLVFLPILAGHDFTWDSMFAAILAFWAFSAAASSIYVVNDLLDLEADRLHTTKRRRPFASGDVPLDLGFALFGFFTLAALGLATLLGPAFLIVLLIYVALSLSYAFRLKRLRWIDILVLAALYSIRVIGGAAASDLAATPYLVAFIFPVFVSLGAVKRLTELTLAKTDARIPGRGYSRLDRPKILNLATFAVAIAMLLFLAYTFTDQARTLYPQRWLLWVAMIPMAWWMTRMVRLGYQGKQDYDPIIFAMRDRRGLGLLMLTLSLMFWGAGLWQRWFAILTNG